MGEIERRLHSSERPEQSTGRYSRPPIVRRGSVSVPSGHVSTAEPIDSPVDVVEMAPPTIQVVKAVARPARSGANYGTYFDMKPQTPKVPVETTKPVKQEIIPETVQLEANPDTTNEAESAQTAVETQQEVAVSPKIASEKAAKKVSGKKRAFRVRKPSIFS